MKCLKCLTIQYFCALLVYISISIHTVVECVPVVVNCNCNCNQNKYSPLPLAYKSTECILILGRNLIYLLSLVRR